MKALVVICVSTIGVIAVSCRPTPSGSQHTDGDLIPQHELCVVDSFGVEMGDSVRMIGSITAMCHHPNGSLLILDRAADCLRMVPSAGIPSRVLRRGSGPGEFLGAQGVCALSDGRIVVADYMKRALMTYDERGDYLGDYCPSFDEDDPPPIIWAVDSCSIVGVDWDHMTIEDRDVSAYYCARFDSDVRPSVMYYLLDCDALGHNESIRAMNLMDFHADRSGQVYVAEDFTEYSIDIYAPDGSAVRSIEAPVSRLEKSQEQIQAEIEEYEAQAVSDFSYQGGYEPSPYDQLISICGVDSTGNLWVRRFDLNAGLHFDIWDSSGTLVYTTSLADLDTSLEVRFLVDEIGMVGAVTDPGDYPRVYFLELGPPTE